MPMHKIYNIASKEVRHILRDVRSLVIAILMPILMTFLYGYAINLDIKNIKLAVIDFDRTLESRELGADFFNSGYFVPSLHQPDISDPERVLKTGNVGAVLTIRSGFAEAIHNKDEFELGLVVDGADANTAAAISSYSNIILGEYVKSKLPPNFEIPGVTISQQVLYNPDLKSSHFFVPGLIAVILMMISALLTSITIAREKETGTMEQLLTAPVTPRQIIIGKVIPYIALALIDGFLILAFAVFHFGVPFIGSTLLLFGLIYIAAALSLGIVISTVVKTQQLAMLVALLLTVMPSVMLSGFIFEIKNMPIVLQVLTHFIPARYFIQIIRGVMLKGSSIQVLWVEAAFLIAMTIGLLAIAVKRFKLKIG
ncbi:MAG: ABC transporter permease [candidate division Zixibacteria bacterium HGW-Zixibacteria-1]|nr:MAG: ABC transporter permease [candidate division Zixibacteria bacterium HGW-Zixibacteria-1]